MITFREYKSKRCPTPSLLKIFGLKLHLSTILYNTYRVQVHWVRRDRYIVPNSSMDEFYIHQVDKDLLQKDRRSDIEIYLHSVARIDPSYDKDLADKACLQCKNHLSKNVHSHSDIRQCALNIDIKY